jgi:phospholipid transport system substrate-binding protein
MAALLFVIPAASLRAQESPVDVVRSRNQTVEQIVRAAGDDVDDATMEQLKDLINSLIDFRELSRRALGRHWNERTEQEKDDFVSVFQQLIRNSSVRKLSIYKADRIEYLEPEIEGTNATVTTIAHKDRREVEVVYKMHLVDDHWRAYDIVIDGASTSRTYRDSFYRQISRSSYGEMYSRLVNRLAEED